MNSTESSSPTADAMLTSFDMGLCRLLGLYGGLLVVLLFITRPCDLLLSSRDTSFRPVGVNDFCFCILSLVGDSLGDTLFLRWFCHVTLCLADLRVVNLTDSGELGELTT